jgi:23S rRNA (guanosine2251-2'-O)-methyltransferase
LVARAPERRGGAPDRHELAGVHPVREALRARRRELHRLRLREGAARSALAGLAELAAAAGVPVEEVDAEELGRRAGPGVAHQGAVLSAGPLPELPLAALGAGPPPRALVALDGVEDPQNVGSIARVAEAAGACGLVLTQRRAPPLGPAVSRASAGAIEWLPVARVVNLTRALAELKERGFWVFGADPEAEDDLFGLSDRVARGDRVVVLGAEGRGLRSGIEQAIDHRVRIPMAGRVASLNVAAAAAVILFELARRSRPPAGPAAGG